jgi:hypothetical protein
MISLADCRSGVTDVELMGETLPMNALVGRSQNPTSWRQARWSSVTVVGGAGLCQA